jgi:hypothetical protein
MQTIEVKEILKKSILEKVRSWSLFKKTEYKIKFKNTCTKKYGSNNPFSNRHKDKIKKKNYK